MASPTFHPSASGKPSTRFATSALADLCHARPTAHTTSPQRQTFPPMFVVPHSNRSRAQTSCMVAQLA
eukprot:6038416-Prorocentrum_lima.AAC.1